MHKKSPRHLARSLAVQGIYYHKLNQATQGEIEDFLQTNCHAIYPVANHELMHFLLDQGMNNFNSMLEHYKPHLQREINEINLIEQVVLVIAAIELTSNLSVPAPVVMNEAVELAKLYGADESYKFINGLVDKLANDLRKDEITHHKK